MALKEVLELKEKYNSTQKKIRDMNEIRLALKEEIHTGIKLLNAKDLKEYHKICGSKGGK